MFPSMENWSGIRSQSLPSGDLKGSRNRRPRAPRFRLPYMSASRRCSAPSNDAVPRLYCYPLQNPRVNRCCLARARSIVPCNAPDRRMYRGERKDGPKPCTYPYVVETCCRCLQRGPSRFSRSRPRRCSGRVELNKASHAVPSRGT